MSQTAPAEHFENLKTQDHAARFGVWVFIASELLFFAVLFTVFIRYRAEYTAGFRLAAEHAALVIGTVNTYVLITSSLSMALAVHAIRHDRTRATQIALGITAFLGCTFLVLKGLEYAAHVEEGLRPGRFYASTELPPENGPLLYFSLYYVMTGIHALHVSVGIGLLVWLFFRTGLGRYSSQSNSAVELVGVYWHLVDIIWIFLWPLFYLMR